MSKNFYLTTTLPYVNAPLHLGHATEIIRADTLARFKKLQGLDIFFNTGTDEHGAKIFESAEKQGQAPEAYTDFYAALYKETLKKFGVLNETEGIHFIRTTNLHHIAAAQEFWKRCDKNGFIYKKNYKAKYCVGCEEEKTDSDLVDGKCPEHNRVPEVIEEENYFFKFSAFGERLLKYYEENPNFIVPSFRMNEMREFIKRGLEDFSISRLKSKMSWGVPVPNDDEHVMYVWFDALTNYISTLGFPVLEGDFAKYWKEGTPTQYCGKNNTRFQGVMWQAMLMAADLPLTHQIIVNGFILGEGGVKMSKTLGNTIDPLDIVALYGIDALRYFVLREFHPFEDTAVSKEKLLESYNANLANGIGNLTSRIMKMAETHLESPVAIEENTIPDSYFKIAETFDFKALADLVWRHIGELDAIIQTKEPFKLIKTEKEEALVILIDLVKRLYIIAQMLTPLLPETSQKIKDSIKSNKMPETALFLRK
jgi:methionyl-tRNA synthetase